MRLRKTNENLHVFRSFRPTGFSVPAAMAALRPSPLARIRGYLRPPVRIPVLVVPGHGNGRHRRRVLFDAFPRSSDWMGARFTGFS